MKSLTWITGGLLFLAFMIATTPASALYWLVNRFAPARITTSATSGTLWHGEAQDLSFTPPGGQIIKLKHMKWNIQAFGLVLGQLPVEIEFGDTGTKGRASLRLTPSGLDVSQLDITLPAAMLGSINPRLDTFQPEGEVTLRSNEFSLRRNLYQGKGEILWKDAAFNLSPVKPAGDYRGEFSGEGENILFLLQTLNGSLELAGSGTWSKQAGVHFSGTAKARKRENDLVPVLRLLGKPDPGGYYVLKF